MKTKVTISMFCLLCFYALAEPVTVDGSITSVIVYRGQALITRTLDLPEGTGDRELLIENLPEKILPESLYAQSDGSVSILSVRYREKAVSEDTRQQVLALKEQIEATQRKIYLAQRDRENIDDRLIKFSGQWQLRVDTTVRDINIGKLDVQSLEQMTNYLEQKCVDLHKEAVRLETEKQDQEKQLTRLNEDLQKLSQERQKVIRQALVYISGGKGAKGEILLSYLVRDANWSAQYNLRAAADKKQAVVEYNATVHQSSGEDWSNVALALSTAQPSIISAPPALTPMQVTLGTGYGGVRGLMPQSDMVRVGGEKAAPGQPVYLSQEQKFNDLIQARRSNLAKGIQAQVALNSIAIDNQMIELEADRRMLDNMKRQNDLIARNEGVSVMYKLKGKLSLPSRTEQQILSIASFDCPAQFVFVASPVLTDYVYLQADITNTGDIILLPGPASMFRNGEFVGRSDMKLVTSGQTFTAGFGIDSQIQVVREFTDKKTDTLLGSRYHEQNYRFAISNYKNVPIKLRLLDRIPYTENESLAVNIKDLSHPLSTDAEYLRAEKPKGLLRWDLVIDPNTVADKATIMTYSYTMKHDKTQVVVPVSVNQ
jgi:predicted transport protein